MKQLQHVTTFSLIIALTGLSPVVAADAGRTSDDEGIQPDQRRVDSPLSYHLSLEQMDGIHAGGKSVNRTCGRGRSGQPDLSTPVVDAVNRTLSTPVVDPVNRTLSTPMADPVNRTLSTPAVDPVDRTQCGRSGQYESLNTTGRR